MHAPAGKQIGLQLVKHPRSSPRQSVKHCSQHSSPLVQETSAVTPREPKVTANRTARAAEPLEAAIPEQVENLKPFSPHGGAEHAEAMWKVTREVMLTEDMQTAAVWWSQVLEGSSCWAIGEMDGAV